MKMALQAAGVSTSKVLILVGAGFFHIRLPILIIHLYSAFSFYGLVYNSLWILGYWDIGKPQFHCYCIILEPDYTFSSVIVSFSCKSDYNLEVSCRPLFFSDCWVSLSFIRVNWFCCLKKWAIV